MHLLCPTKCQQNTLHFTNFNKLNCYVKDSHNAIQDSPRSLENLIVAI